jgi:hypothetical protein
MIGLYITKQNISEGGYKMTTQYKVTITYGIKYTGWDFASKEEAQSFIDKYQHNQERLERDFDDLPQAITARATEHDENFVTIEEVVE